MSKQVPEGFRKLPVEGFGSHGSFEELIGPIHVADITPTSIRFGLFVEQKHCNYYDIVHGGVFVSLVDSMMGNLVFASLEPGRRVATISITSDFMGVGKIGEWVEGDASILRRGGSIAFTDARIRAGEKLIFLATAKWAISR